MLAIIRLIPSLPPSLLPPSSLPHRGQTHVQSARHLVQRVLDEAHVTGVLAEAPQILLLAAAAGREQ